MLPAPRSERFRGWSLLGLSTLAISFTLPGQTIGVSSFAEHLTDDLKISSTTLSAAYLIGTIVGALTMPAFGRWIDRAGVRKTMITIATAFSLQLPIWEPCVIYGCSLSVSLASECSVKAL